MSNSIHSTPQQPIKVPRTITVPVNQQQQQHQQQDKKILFILAIAILVFLLLLLLLFLSYMNQPVGNSDQSGYPLPNQNAASETNGGTDTASSGTDITSSANTDQVHTQNEQGIDELGDETDTTTTNPDKPLSEKNSNNNKTPISENSSQNTQEAVIDSETKSIEPDKTTAGEKLANKLIEEQNTTNNTNFSLEQHDATLRIFGTIGKGSSFVFVFDRSGSMRGPRIKNAQLELIQALESLNQQHRFNIIFYNDEQFPWKKNSLVSATKKNKNNAVTFIEGISAGGKTEPLKPLLDAISYKPDFIFFLTDGAFALNLDDVCQKAGKTKINVIQFESDSAPSTLLQKLAERTQGDYIYINIGQLDKL
ncbi:MAG: VWA domain-containing protein [Planctomycetaceae bacterium]|jgi:Mg-chelatase subunit ChlD|nr:VWA domain-containing protein [Planctomycetaceae bacterium]